MWHKILGEVMVACVFAVSAAPQEALIVELSKDETVQARQLHQRLVAAEADWQKFKNEIRMKYGPILAKEVPEGSRINMAQPSAQMPIEWFQGIEFSTDFRFAVPRHNSK